MRVILNPPVPPAAVPTVAVPAAAQPGEPAGVTWCRDIATTVAAALDTGYQNAYHRHVRRPRRHQPHGCPVICPETLFVGFTAAGHRVDIAVVWDHPSREPGFALTVNTEPVAFRAPGRPRTAPVLAHAALRAIVAHTRQPSEPSTVRTHAVAAAHATGVR